VVARRDREEGEIVRVKSDGYVVIKLDSGRTVTRAGSRTSLRAARAQQPNQQPQQPNAPEPNAPQAPGGRLTATEREAQAPTHPRARMASATGEDYESWGDRADDIAAAARARVDIGWLMENTRNDEAKAAVKAAFGDGQAFGSKGLRVKIGNIRTYGNGTGTTQYEVDGSIVDERGNSVGRLQRVLKQDENGNWSVYNAFLKIEDKNLRGGGFISEYARYMEDWYIANGVDYVGVSADLENGGYVWAHTGFDWAPDVRQGTIGFLLDAIQVQANREGDNRALDQVQQYRDQLNASDAIEDWPTPQDLALIGWEPGKDKWAGHALNGKQWHGRKYLDPDARTYLQRREFELAKRQQRQMRQLDELADPNNQPWAKRSPAFSDPIDKLFATSPGGQDDAAFQEIQAVIKGRKKLGDLSPRGYHVFQREVRAKWLDPQFVADDANFAALQAMEKDLSAHDRVRYPDAAFGPEVAAIHNATYDEIRRRNIGPEFDVISLNDTGEAGAIGDTYRIVHRPSGRTYYVKAANEEGSQAEVDAITAARALGINGAPSVIPHDYERRVVIMTAAGDGQPVASAFEAGKARGRGLDMYYELPAEFIANPADLIAFALHDYLISNGDRHSKNYFVGIDSDGKYHYFPIDHGLALRGNRWGGAGNPSAIAQQVQAGSKGKSLAGVLTLRPTSGPLRDWQRKIGEARMLELWEAKVREVSEKLNDPNLTWQDQGNLSDMLEILNGIQEDLPGFVDGIMTGRVGNI
jgi:hypothetical protein